MKLQIADRVVASSHEFNSTQCTIDAEDMKYIASLLRNNYSDTILATVRETFANAVDATKDNNEPVSKIVVTLPTYLDPTYSVRDFGAGITPEKIRSLYTKYGKSTKRDNNTSIGGYGIGKFAPLSYNKDGFTVTSFVNGEKRVYLMYISEEDDTKIDELYCGPTDEPNGVCISVAVNKHDVNNFIAVINKFFVTFDELPTFINLPHPIVKDEKVLNGKDWYIRNNDHNSCIVMGGISYPISFNVIDFNSPIKYVRGLVLVVPIGSVKLHHSREALEYNKTTKDFLIQKCFEIDKEIRKNIETKFQNLNCLKVAKQEFAKLQNILPYDLMQSYLNNTANSPFKYKDVVITDHRFNSVHYNTSTGVLRIPAKCRRYELNTMENGLTQSRSYSISANETVAYVLNDCDDKTKIICRIFSLLKNDSGKQYKEVIVISHDSESADKNTVNGVEKFSIENRFDLVTTDLFKLSSLTPVKMPAKTKNCVTYNSNYYFSTSHSRNKFFPAAKADIEDTSLIKPYIEVANRQPLSDLYELKRQGGINCSFFNSFFNCFESEVYGVSTAVSNSAKFKKQTHFVKLVDYIKNYWDNIPEEDKQFIKNACLFKNSSCLHYEFEFMKKLHKINPECFKDVAVLLNEQKNIKEDPRYTKMNNFIEFFNDYIIRYDCLRKIVSNVKEYEENTIDSFCENQFQKYPLLKHLCNINEYSVQDYSLFLSQSADYVVMVDKQMQKTP